MNLDRVGFTPLSLLLLVFNIVAVRRVLKPLKRAEADVDALHPEDGLLRLSEAPEPRELNTLVRAINRPLTRPDEAMAILRRFTAKAEHDGGALFRVKFAAPELPP